MIRVMTDAARSPPDCGYDAARARATLEPGSRRSLRDIRRGEESSPTFVRWDGTAGAMDLPKGLRHRRGHAIYQRTSPHVTQDRSGDGARGENTNPPPPAIGGKSNPQHDIDMATMSYPLRARDGDDGVRATLTPQRAGTSRLHLSCAARSYTPAPRRDATRGRVTQTPVILACPTALSICAKRQAAEAARACEA